VPNGLNQYVQIAGQAINYDANGNLLTGEGVSYQYDDENRLASTSGTVASTIKYDPLGRLFETTIAGAKTQFLYDGDALVAEYNSAGALTRRYVHGDQVDEPWVQYNGNLVGAAYRRFLHADHQGSIIAHSSNSGAVLNSLAYDAYGIPRDANIDRFGYTGQIWLKELGLFYYKARIYSPRLGRFLQTDPVGYEDQMNLYAYVGNDPVNLVDPTGMMKVNANCEGILCQEILEGGGGGGVPRGSSSPSRSTTYPTTISQGVHGNSRTSTKSQHRYEIRDKTTGDVKKTGISGQELNKDGSSPRANSQVNAINKAEGTNKVEASVKETNIPGREAALKSEQQATNQLKADGHSLERQCRPKPETGAC
jgi:RHS repeat-associated protein